MAAVERSSQGSLQEVRCWTPRTLLRQGFNTSSLAGVFSPDVVSLLRQIHHQLGPVAETCQRGKDIEAVAMDGVVQD